MTDTAWERPPRTAAPDGSERRVGVELEFTGLSAVEAAEVVQATFGGRLVRHDAHKIGIKDTAIGDVLAELDFKYAHSEDGDDPLREFLGDVGATVLPMEIVCPPLALGDAPRLEELRRALRAAGAEGTKASPFYAFGVQLNPELPDHGAGYILSVLRAYILLRAWLRSEIRIDKSRQVWFFAAPFPERWCRKVLDPDYSPDLGRLIDDYIADNDTRNREVDMLPLFAELDRERVRRRLPDEAIKPRPTYHYRLPNTMIDAEEWSIGLEWSRWVAVERLAERQDLIERHSRRWLEDHDGLIPPDWTGPSREIRAAL